MPTQVPPKPSERSSDDSLQGFLLALAAYLIWGTLPLYIHALAEVPAVEFVAHRVVWSLPIAGLAIVLLGRTLDLRAALRSPRTLALAALTAALVSTNWGLYIWAIEAGRTLDAALGYYINPLFSVALGAILLGEPLGRAQRYALGLAGAAVALLTWESGTLPWLAFVLTVTWGFYAFFRKTLPIGPNQGFFLEILLMTPFALGYLIWLELHAEGHFLRGAPVQSWLLVGSGLMTALPLLLYGYAARQLRLSTVGMMQYIVPTAVFLIAVFVFRESFSMVKLAAFSLIWAGVALFLAGSLRARRRRGLTAD